MGSSPQQEQARPSGSVGRPTLPPWRMMLAVAAGGAIGAVLAQA